jgi:alpha-beta hydrolase superfamily lysophospholipase
VYGIDFPGHGESVGTSGLINSAEDLTTDALEFVKYIQVNHRG